MMMTNPPKGVGFGDGIKAGISSTWSGIFTDKFNVNFAVKHYVALIICWIWAIYIDKFGGACVITAVFLMSTAICPDIQAILNVMNAVIVAVIVGTLVFQASCGTGYGDFALPISAVLIWVVGLYGYFSAGPLLLPSLVVVALTPFRWVTMCPTGEIAAGARALWAGMVGNVMAIVFVCSCQFFMAIDRAGNLALKEMDGAFQGEIDAFKAFWSHGDATGPMAPVAGHLGAGAGYNGSAKIEPRFHRAPWKGDLYAEVITQLGQVRLDILMLWFAMAGSDGKPDGIFAKFEHSPNFQSVQDDLNATFEEAKMVVLELLKDDGKSLQMGTLNCGKSGFDVLDALRPLVDDLGKPDANLRFPTTVGDSMEDDELCQIASVFLLLDFAIKHIAAILQTSIRKC